MKTTLVFVTTLDGKITKWGDPHVFQWSSKADQTYFKKLWNDAKLLIMGSSTFDFDPVKPSPDRLLVIMTREPEKYKQYVVEGQLEFTSETPTEIYKRFEGTFDEMMVVGGAHVATYFLKDNLIDEFSLSLEPKIFGSGGNFVIESELDISLRLVSYEKANDEGTLILKYEVVK